MHIFNEAREPGYTVRSFNNFELARAGPTVEILIAVHADDAPTEVDNELLNCFSAHTDTVVQFVQFPTRTQEAHHFHHLYLGGYAFVFSVICPSGPNLKFEGPEVLNEFVESRAWVAKYTTKTWRGYIGFLPK